MLSRSVEFTHNKAVTMDHFKKKYAQMLKCFKLLLFFKKKSGEQGEKRKKLLEILNFQIS